MSFDVANCVIYGLGAATPVGRNAWSSAAAVRAGISGFTRHPFMTDTVARPMHLAMCPWLPPDLDASRRITRCLVDAVQQALAPLIEDAGGSGPPSVVLLIGLPLERPGLPNDFGPRLQAALEKAFGNAVSKVVVARRGHAAGLIALKSATTLLLNHAADACVVAGADSYIDLETLEWLEETEQIHGAGPRNNAWGFIPGEGAGAVLLLPPTAVDRGMQPLVAIAGTGFGREENLIRTDSVCLGRGLTGAFEEAMASLPSPVLISDTYCDLNGEPYRADEFGFAVTRTRERFVSATDFTAPADCWGDVGAASGPLGLVLASIAIQKRYSRGDVGLVWASSDTGERGATVVTPV